MIKLFFQVHEFSFCIEHEGKMEEALALRLSETVSFFRQEKDQETTNLCIRIIKKPCDFPRFFLPFLRTKVCKAYGWGNIRYCDYGGGHGTKSFFQNGRPRLTEVFFEREDLGFEMAYVALQSALGEELDKRGFHRIHALGGNVAQQTFLLLAPPGGGKSSLAAQLLMQRCGHIFSDECPLAKDKKIYPFPLPLALGPALAEHLGFSTYAKSRLFRRKIFPPKLHFFIQSPHISKPRGIDHVFLGKRGVASKIHKASRLKILFGLLENMVVGLGLTQMAEYMLRPLNFFTLSKIGFSRLREAVNVAWRAEGFIFYLSPFPAENFETLLNFYNVQQRHGIISEYEEEVPVPRLEEL